MIELSFNIGFVSTVLSNDVSSDTNNDSLSLFRVNS